MEIPKIVIKKRIALLQDALAGDKPHPLLVQFFNEESIVGIHKDRSDILFSDAKYPYKKYRHPNPSIGIVNGIEDFIHEVCHVVEIEESEHYRLCMESLGMGIQKQFLKHFGKLLKTAVQRERRTSAIQYVFMKHLDLMGEWNWDKQYPSITASGDGSITQRRKKAREDVLELTKEWTIESIIENWWAKNTYLKCYWTPINNNVRCKY